MNLTVEGMALAVIAVCLVILTFHWTWTRAPLVSGLYHAMGQVFSGRGLAATASAHSIRLGVCVGSAAVGIASCFMNVGQVGALPRPKLVPLPLELRPLAAWALGAVADQMQHVAAEAIVVDAHTDGLELDVMMWRVAIKPPSRRALETLHYLQDGANYGRSYPRSSSEVVRLIAWFLKRRRGVHKPWPVPQLAGFLGPIPPLAGVAGVDSIAAQGFPALGGAVILVPGFGISLNEVGQTITVDNTQTPGLSSLILFDQTLSGAAASIDTGANGIAQTAHTLVIDCLLRTTEAVVVSTALLRFNNDSGANYDRSTMQVLGTTLTGANTHADTSAIVAVAGATATASTPCAVRIVIHGYRQTTFHKSLVGEVGFAGSAGTDSFQRHMAARWRDTTAINQVSITAGSGNLVAGSRMTVYGLL